MKKVLSITLCLVMVLSIFTVLPLSAAADDNVCGDFTYVVLADDTAKITGYSGTDTEVVIPGTVDGYTVTELGAVFNGNAAVTSVTIPDTVTSIGDYAFYKCYQLSVVELPPALLTIGENAFGYCYKLPNLTIPGTVTFIGTYAFNNCDSFTEITVPDSVVSMGYDVFSWSDSLTNVTLPSGMTSIPKYTFSACTAMKNYTVPDGITTIGDQAFYYSGLRTVTIPKTVTKIENGAFIGTGLTDVYYAGTEEEWNAISIGSSNAPLNNAVMHFATSSYILGDVDGDGDVSIIDATYIQRYEVNITIPVSDEDILLRGDVDGDGEVTIIDATMIKRYDIGISVAYPIGEPIA